MKTDGQDKHPIAVVGAGVVGLCTALELVRRGEQVELYDEVLIVQASQSLQSAESAYAAGTADALDLLDAERVLLQVRIAAERVRTDFDRAVAKLEGVIAGPLAPTGGEME